MKPLYLIDFSNFAYKFQSTLGTHCSVNINGVRVSTAVLYGFYKALKNNPFSDIMVVLDGYPKDSYSLLPTYKGTRNHEKDDLVSVPRLELIKFLSSVGSVLNKNIKVVCSPLQETDQVISSIVHSIVGKLPKRSSFVDLLNTHDFKDDQFLCNYATVDKYKVDLSGYDSVVIASTDGDFVQLLRFPNVFVDKTTSGKEIASVITTDSTAGLPPAATAIYKAIFGDVSDNIPPIGSFNKAEVLKALESITTSEQIEAFYAIVTSPIVSTNLNTDLTLLAEEIRDTGLASRFDRNFGITYLKFWSLPYELHYSDYNIEDTFNKYKIRR